MNKEDTSENIEKEKAKITILDDEQEGNNKVIAKSKVDKSIETSTFNLIQAVEESGVIPIDDKRDDERVA